MYKLFIKMLIGLTLSSNMVYAEQVGSELYWDYVGFKDVYFKLRVYMKKPEKEGRLTANISRLRKDEISESFFCYYFTTGDLYNRPVSDSEYCRVQLFDGTSDKPYILNLKDTHAGINNETDANMINVSLSEDFRNIEFDLFREVFRTKGVYDYYLYHCLQKPAANFDQDYRMEDARCDLQLEGKAAYARYVNTILPKY